MSRQPKIVNLTPGIPIELFPSSSPADKRENAKKPIHTHNHMLSHEVLHTTTSAAADEKKIRLNEIHGTHTHELSHRPPLEETHEKDMSRRKIDELLMRTANSILITSSGVSLHAHTHTVCQAMIWRLV